MCIRDRDLKEPLRESMKKRLPWLIVLLGLGMVVSSVVGMFEHVVTEPVSYTHLDVYKRQGKCILSCVGQVF